MDRPGLHPSPTALLLTGAPGVGKTTVIREVARQLPGSSLAGFYTEEIREGGVRKGFRLVPFQGPSKVMAHVDFPMRFRVSKYGVDVEMLEEVAASLLSPASPVDLYLVDEIGKMECFSPRFVAAMRSLLDGGRPLVATVARKGGGLIAEVRSRADAELWEVTRGNRDSLPRAVVDWIRSRAPFGA
jgi:nucleoside-triphosphatase